MELRSLLHLQIQSKLLKLQNHDIICDVGSIVIRMTPQTNISFHWPKTEWTIDKVSKIVNILY